MSTNDVPNSATFTLVHSGERHTLVLDDIDAVDTTADDDCHEPAPVARITWSTP